MANKRLDPEGATRRGAEGETEADVEGHGRRLDTKATPTEEPGAGPETGRQRVADDEADVEGHNFGHNAMLSRNAQQTRERDVQRNLRQHELKTEAKRPFFKKG
jgi:hypothetical protein